MAGNAGYLEIVRHIYATVDSFISGISAVPGMRVLGKPDAYLLAFESEDPRVDILAVDAGARSHNRLLIPAAT